MNEEHVLAKTNRINMLFDFYEHLLTEKQQTFLKCYFHDDFSLGEIAAEFGISRQAVYEHIKRAEQTLEAYESKLELMVKFEQRMKLTVMLHDALTNITGMPDPQRAELQAIVRELQALD
ncbi:putative DNA-binding protein [Paenibacillus sp. 481]|uniref:putative DNA-binding protein n=1 Tax=Paenibacillus sp. 481 TaxID=2835869 RepID=UPI001E4E7801|nr:putative DNA-binding protein [Paenibacillus sp. 481]UHA73965.1 putative DNA-binding protein [Paenibacillus sp. 481]